MTFHRSRDLGFVVVVIAAGFFNGGPGLVCCWSQEPGATRPAAGKAGDIAASPDDQVAALIRQYDDARIAEITSWPNPGGSLPLTANYAKLRQRMEPFRRARAARAEAARGLLALAERHPRTNAAEQALTWLACNEDNFLGLGAEAERAREILARDHARSDRIKVILSQAPRGPLWTSPTMEALLRRALELSPYYEIRGLACYRLAQILTQRAYQVRLWQLLGRPAKGDFRVLAAGAEVVPMLRASDPERLEQEAARLLERTIAEYPGLVEGEALRDWLGIRSGLPARTDLDRLRRLSVGKPAPEIAGVDLEGKPMKLSGFRGQVVVLHFRPNILFLGAHTPSTAGGPLRGLTTAFSGKPTAFVGVVNRQIDDYRKEFRRNGGPARFWADPATPEHADGPIHAAWGAGANSVVACYVLDPRGTIRSALPDDAGLIQKAVADLLEEEARGRAPR